MAGNAVGRTPWSAIGVKIRPFGQSQAARRDVAQTLVSAAPRLISALFVHEQEARQECRAGRLKPAPRRVGDQFRPCNGLILTPMRGPEGTSRGSARAEGTSRGAARGPP